MNADDLNDDNEHSFLRNDTDNRSASVVQIESNRLLPWLMVTSLLSGVAVALAIGAMMRAEWAAREFKQVQIQLMYANAIMLREGLVQPGDQVYGPEGNLEYRRHELRRKER